MTSVQDREISDTVKCFDGIPAEIKECKQGKPENIGQKFYCCQYSKEDQCKFFEWLDKSKNKWPSRAPKDYVPKTGLPYIIKTSAIANPIAIASPTDPSNKKRKLEEPVDHINQIDLINLLSAQMVELQSKVNQILAIVSIENEQQN